MLRLSSALMALMILAPTGGPASAQQQPVCTKRANVLKHLANKYAEAPVAIGLANNGGVIEVLTSETGDSWTIIITMPNGTACMVAAGEDWENVRTTVAEGPAA